MTALAHDRPTDLAVSIECEEIPLEADWSIPLRPRGTIILTSCGYRNRFARNNRHLARALYETGFATVLLDLLTPDENMEDALTGAVRLDIDLMAHRIATAARWVRDQDEVAHLPVGCLASGIASAAALVSSTRDHDLFAAVVSRHGRPDLAGIRLHQVKTPILLLVGEHDTRCRELNRWALRRLNCDKNLEVLAGASHHFEDEEALCLAGDLSCSWFRKFMPALSTRSRSLFSINWTEGKPGTPRLSFGHRFRRFGE